MHHWKSWLVGKAQPSSVKKECKKKVIRIYFFFHSAKKSGRLPTAMTLKSGYLRSKNQKRSRLDLNHFLQFAKLAQTCREIQRFVLKRGIAISMEHRKHDVFYMVHLSNDAWNMIENYGRWWNINETWWKNGSFIRKWNVMEKWFIYGMAIWEHDGTWW